MLEKDKNDNKTVDIEDIIEWQKFVKDVNFRIYRDKEFFYHNTNVPVLDFERKNDEVSLNLAKSPESRVLIKFLINMLDITNNDAGYKFYISWLDDRGIENHHGFNQIELTNEETHVNLVFKKKEIVKLKNREQ